MSDAPEYTQEPGYTPGPWSVVSGFFPGVDSDFATTSIVVYGERYEEQVGVQGRTKEEGMANARLIAASPELHTVLSICRYVLGHFQGDTTILPHMVAPIDDACKAADIVLAKVRGAA